MKKNLRSSFYIVIIFFELFGACKKESSSPIQIQLKPYTGNLQFELLPQSIETVMTAQMPWELKSLNYYNVIKQDTGLHMFYNSFAYDQVDFEGSFCLAQSSNGNVWSRILVDNNTNILIDGQNKKGIMGSFVFVDSFDAVYPYKMICVRLVNENQKTFLYGSPDGKKWTVVKQLFDVKQDSQFSVIRFNGEYYVFVRYNDYKGKYQRAVGLSILDNYFNVVQQPYLLLEAPANDDFSQIYNSAASKANDSTVLLFPTYYDNGSGNIQIKLLYTNNMKDYYSINDNINRYLFPNGNVNWAIVSPGLIPADQKDTYWIYYYATASRHNDFTHVASFNISYSRIKMIIHR